MARATLISRELSLPIDGDGAVIGSGANCRFRVGDTSVGTEHARVHYRNGRWWLTDLGSGQPTSLSGQVLASGSDVILVSSASFWVGDREIYFVVGDAPLATSPPPPPRRRGGSATQTQAGAPALTVTIGSGCGVARLGRDPANDLVLPNRNVSRVHAEVRWDGLEVTIRDLNSTNGTKVNGVFIATEQRLHGGEHIHIGPFVIEVRGSQLKRLSPVAESVVSVRNAALWTQGAYRLQPMSFEVAPGELVAVIGPSGSGKTTLIKLLASVLDPSEGAILVSGESRNHRKWDVGYVPQEDTLHSLLQVRETIGYSARLRLPSDTTAAELDRIVSTVVTDVDLGLDAHKLVGHLSGGQRKRLSLATEIVAQPRLLLLDEPTAGLDPARDTQIMSMVRKIAAAPRAVVVVTHSTRWLRLFDRVLVIGASGQLAFHGEEPKLLDHFGARGIDDVFEALGDRSPRTIRAIPRVRERIRADRARASARPRRMPLRHEVRALAERSFKGLLRDRANLVTLCGPVLLAGLVVGLLFGHDPFGPRADSTKSAQLLFALVLTLTIVGAGSTIREVVREKALLQRELAAGVRVSAYVGSKMVVFGSVVTFQAIALVLTALAIAPLHDTVATYAEVVLVLSVAGVAAVLIGLLLSALAQSEAHAVTLLSLAVIPHVLFAGAIVAVRDMGPLKPVANLVSTRWAYAGVGSAVDLPQRALHDHGFHAFYGDEFFQSGPLPFVAILLAYIVLVAALVVGTLRVARG